jgi:hypothetical protein
VVFTESLKKSGNYVAGTPRADDDGDDRAARDGKTLTTDGPLPRPASSSAATTW